MFPTWRVVQTRSAAVQQAKLLASGAVAAAMVCVAASVRAEAGGQTMAALTAVLYAVEGVGSPAAAQLLQPLH